MPYLQLDVPYRYPADAKRRVAQRMGEIYSDMRADVNRISVAIREIGEDGLWRCTNTEPYLAALLMYDIRAGRPSEQRAALAEALIAACVAFLGLRVDQVNVEFTTWRA